MAENTEMLFTEYFFKHAQFILPSLLKRLKAWGAGAVLAHLRDFAGINAAEILDLPVVSFGSHGSPVRVEALDPPFGSGLARNASQAQRSMMWKLHHQFHENLDPHYNRMLRFPHDLKAVRGSTAQHSSLLVLLSLVASLGNTHAPQPEYVHYLGSMFSGLRQEDATEEALLAHIKEAPRPRIAVSLGTTYGSSLLPKCLEALADFEGTVIASGGGASSNGNRIVAPFFKNVDGVLDACDAVVTVCGGKTVMDALRHGLPIVGLPRQGEQKEIALALFEQGAAILPCLRKWDSRIFRDAVAAVASGGNYKASAARLQAECAAAGGIKPERRF